jgi:acyl-coenzyme A synthetase/AMP-(fatty) acid ligase
LVTALVILKEGFTLTEDEIKDCLIKAGVESFKHIRGGVKFVKEFPKNLTGKIERSKLPEYFLNA